MNVLENGIFCACMTAMGLRLAEGVLPMARFSKQIRTLFMTFLLICMLRPLVGLELSSVVQEVPIMDISEELSAMGEAARCEAVAQSIRKSLDAELHAHHVECEVAEVAVHITEEGGIVIDEVWITGSTLTGTVYLREWLDEGVKITPRKEASE